MNHPVIIVDILKEVVDSMSIKAYFDAGRQSQIIKKLNYLDNSISMKDNKYPLIAVIMPFDEMFEGVHYCRAIIDRIIIATVTNSGKSVLERYDSADTFKTVLYPVYTEFLSKLARHRNVIGSDPSMFIHTKMDVPGVHPIGEGLSDYIDSIDILNLEVIFSQTKTC